MRRTQPSSTNCLHSALNLLVAHIMSHTRHSFSLTIMSASKAQKKRRTDDSGVPEFGAPSEDDRIFATNRLYTPSSSSASSSRHINPPNATIPSLATLCARRFATCYKKLRENERLWKGTTPYLQLIPDAMIHKLFVMLVAAYPTYLDHAVIATVGMKTPITRI